MKKRQRKSHVPYALAVVLAAVAVSFAYVSIQTGTVDIHNSEITPSRTAEEQVLFSLAQKIDVQSHASYPADVKLLSDEEFDRLRQEEPAIYGDVPEGTYRIIYHGPEDSLLVIYDFSTDKILKIFVVTNIVI